MEKRVLSIKDIEEFLPHRYPFLLVDKVLEYSGEHVLALKNVTINEPFFAGHFPDNPVMPGVMQIEAMAQACAFFAYEEFAGSSKGLEVLFMGLDKVRFRRVVVPGDTLMLEANLLKKKREFWWCEAKATVDGELACEAAMTALMKGLK